MWPQQAMIVQLLPTLPLTRDYFDIFLSYYIMLNSSIITKHFWSLGKHLVLFSLKSLDSQENKTNISLRTSN